MEGKKDRFLPWFVLYLGLYTWLVGGCNVMADVKVKGKSADSRGVVNYAPFEPIILTASEVSGKSAQFLWDVSGAAQTREVGERLFVWAPPGTYSVVLTAIDFDAKKVERAKFTFTVSGSPPTPPDPGPKPPDPTPPTPTVNPFPNVTGLHVLIVMETADGNELNKDQRAIVRGETSRNYLLNKTARNTDNPNGAFRIWDKDINASSAPKVWQDALTRAKGTKDFKTPWLMVGNGKGGHEGPLPSTLNEFLELCKRFE